MSVSPPDFSRTSVLFVCLGNICRSPLAEGVFRGLVQARGIEHIFEIDSAGTGAWHAGEPPDRRSVAVAAAHGIHLEGTARQVTARDMRHFDLIVAMDGDNLRDLEHMANGLPGGAARLTLLRDFDPDGGGSDVPDPYYGGPGGFETVYDMVHRSCEALLDNLRDGAGD
jgi:protein-tyrosine phosphatase